jgi:hypothetical protein
VDKVACIVLNRNIPDVTDRLVEHINHFDGLVSDVFVLESGSNHDKLSKYVTWHADWEEAMRDGLRYPRGMNYALGRLWDDNIFKNYKAFFLLTNDTEFENKPTIAPLMEILDQHSKVGILSPCSCTWGEKHLLTKTPTKYFWYILNNALLLRREFIEDICCLDEPHHFNFLFDGSNFRGWGTESEIIAKGYMNDWAAAITSLVWAEENESHLLNYSDLIRTTPYRENLVLYLNEGAAWVKKKYGFRNKWALQQYVKMCYDNFFEFSPELSEYKL